MIEIDEEIAQQHLTRMRKIYTDSAAAFIGIIFSLGYIYVTLRFGTHLKTPLTETANQVLVITTAAIYIFAQLVALGVCRLQTLNSRLTLKRDLRLHALKAA